ncbi:MAG: response regulator transcription factor [Candidatus Nanopelagicales bacterium]
MTVPSAGRRPAVRVLVVEDEAAIRRVIVGYLHREGFDVVEAGDGVRAVEAARETRPDVVVLDLMLPGLDGVEVCRQLRTFSDAYVLMLTARREEVDMLIGLSVGADDYLTKPFSPRELIARVRVMLRRPRAEAGVHGVRRRTFGELVIDPDAREVSLGGVRVGLTRTEFDILDTLSGEPRTAFPRHRLGGFKGSMQRLMASRGVACGGSGFGPAEGWPSGS